MNKTELTDNYPQWLASLKQQIASAQQRAALTVNQELIQLYWQMGSDILQRQAEQGWGSKVIERLAKDLSQAFPGLKGFSARNIKYMRAFAEAWPITSGSPSIVQQPVAQIPWGHNLVLLSKLKTSEQRLWYARKTIEHGWSRNVLVHQIESGLMQREGRAISNFGQNLPNPQSELAQATLKDPYIFDFLSLGAEAHERDIEQALTRHITQFLLELGASFAFVGRQVELNVGGDDFYLDLLFYHLKLRCYVVVELKTGDFKPEHAGQLSFYLSAVDAQVKSEQDVPSIGLLLCIPFALQISAVPEEASGCSVKALPAWSWHRAYMDVFTASFDGHPEAEFSSTMSIKHETSWSRNTPCAITISRSASPNTS